LEPGISGMLVTIISKEVNNMKENNGVQDYGCIWLNGELVPWDKATTNICAYGLQYGLGVFEGIRCYRMDEGWGVFRLDTHIDRLFQSAAAYRVKLPYTPEDLKNAVEEVIKANRITGESAYIRPIVWLGTGPSGLQAPVETAVIVWPWKLGFDDDRSRNGIRVTIPPWRKIHTSMLPSTAKGCGQYLSALLAVPYAVMRGFDESLLLDAAGNLAEGTSDNVFLVQDGKLLTNDEASSILLGITRDSVITIARDLGMDVEVRNLTQEDLFKAQEVFLTGTAIEIVRVREVDGKAIGSNVHPVTDRLQDVFHGVTHGLNQAYRRWIHCVPFHEVDQAAVFEPSAEALSQVAAK
jgi:branched-chain amino acid aminotransferase